MENFEGVFLAIQLIVAILIVVLVLLQRSEGGALGIGGGGPGNMMTSRGSANLLTKVTKWMAVIFIVNSLILGNISANRGKGSTALDIATQQEESQDQSLPEKPNQDSPLPEKDGSEKNGAEKNGDIPLPKKEDKKDNE